MVFLFDCDVATVFSFIPPINSNLKGFEPILDDTGKMTGYKTFVGGADTVFPFSSNPFELLWENNTISTFAAQTIPLSLDDYDGIIIAFTGRLTWNSMWYFYVPQNVEQGCNVSMNGDKTNQTGSAHARLVTTTNTGVGIGASNSGDNSTCIPRKIYGVKGMLQQ